VHCGETSYASLMQIRCSRAVVPRSWFFTSVIESIGGMNMAKKSNDPVLKARMKFSWGILLGMLGIPILALMLKVFPSRDLAWFTLMGLCGLVVVSSAIGFLLSGSKGNSTTSKDPAALVH